MCGVFKVFFPVSRSREVFCIELLVYIDIMFLFIPFRSVPFIPPRLRSPNLLNYPFGCFFLGVGVASVGVCVCRSSRVWRRLVLLVFLGGGGARESISDLCTWASRWGETPFQSPPWGSGLAVCGFCVSEVQFLRISLVARRKPGGLRFLVDVFCPLLELRGGLRGFWACGRYGFAGAGYTGEETEGEVFLFGFFHCGACEGLQGVVSPFCFGSGGARVDVVFLVFFFGCGFARPTHPYVVPWLVSRFRGSMHGVCRAFLCLCGLWFFRCLRVLLQGGRSRPTKLRRAPA